MIKSPNVFAKFHDRVTADGTQARDLISFAFKLPGYEVLEELGRGGMGVAYKARQLSLGRFVAIKTLAGSRWAQPAFVSRLRKEAKALSSLNHPNVVQVFDIVETASSLSVVLEFVDGVNLTRRMQGRPIPSRDAARFALILARTLAIVHARGLLHRDIKPANVLIDQGGEIKLADFGLAKELGAADGLTITGEVYGSPSYMAPEQADGRKDGVDVRTDIYGLGATLYEMLTGRPPFVGTSTVDTLNQVLHRDPVELRILNPGTSRDLEIICLKCLEKQPDQRFRTATELADELERFFHGLPIHSRPIGILERCRRWCRRRPATAGLMGLSMAAAITIMSLIVSSSALHQRTLTRHNQDLQKLNEDLVASAMHARDLQRIAEENERQAKASEARANDGLYASEVFRAAIAWKQEDTQELTTLLERHIPKPGEIDRRGFEWWYLRRQSTVPSRVLLETGSKIYAIRQPVDRSRMTCVGQDAMVRIFNTETGVIEKQFPTGQNESNDVWFMTDGKELVTSGDDGTIRIWNCESGEERLKIVTPFRKVYGIWPIQDESRLVAYGQSPVICVFDSRTGEELYRLEGHTGVIDDFVIGPGGRLFATVGNDQVVRLWDLLARSEIGAIPMPSKVEHIVFSQNARWLITGDSTGLLQSFDIETKQVISSAKHLDRIGALRIHNHNGLLAVGDHGGRIRLWAIDEAGQFVDKGFQAWQAHRGKVGAIRWSTDFSRLISCGADGRVASWNLTAAQRPKRQRSSEVQVRGSWPFADLPRTSIIMPNLAFNLVAQWNSQLRFPARKEGNLYRQFSVSSDGKKLAALRMTGAVELFEVPDDRSTPIDSDCLAIWNSKPIETIVGFTAESRFLVIDHPPVDSNDWNTNPRVWLHALPTLEPVESIPVPLSQRQQISPDGHQIAMTTAKELILWDLFKKEVIWRVPQSGIRHLCFSADGQLLATAISNRSIQIWNVIDGTLRVQLTNHRSLITRMTFSPDSKTLVTATEDRSIKFSHIATGQELLELPDIGLVHRLEFSDDGHRLICQTSTYDGTTPDEVEIFDASDVSDDDAK